MTCESKISKAITSNCTTQPVGGLEVEAYIGDRANASPTYDVTDTSKVTALAMTTGTLFKIKGEVKQLNAGHDRVIVEGLADMFKHYFSFKGFEVDAASVENLDNLKDVFVVVNYKNKTTTGDGVFVIYGLRSGLYPSTDTKRANENNGTRSIELTSLDNQLEKNSQNNYLATDYATTLAALEALLT